MLFKEHTNEDGSFQELAHSNDVEFGQLSILKINPCCERGGHYHARKEEWFCCIRGICAMTMVDVRDNKKRVEVMGEDVKEFVKVEPYEKHTVANLSESTTCEILIIISEPYDPKDADTFTEYK